MRRQERQKADDAAERVRRLRDQQRENEARQKRKNEDFFLRQQQATHEKERQRTEKINSIYHTSGFYSMLKEVQAGLNQDGIYKNDIIASNDRLKIELVWGNKYKINRSNGGNPEVVYDRGILGLSDGVVDYSAISVLIDPSRMQLHIAGATSHVIKTDRLSDCSFIEDTIVACFETPRRVNQHEPQGSSYDSSNSTNSECCNN